MELVRAQKDFFNSGRTLDKKFRIEQLRKIFNLINKNEKAIFEALQKDLKKSVTDSFLSELTLVYNEINYLIKNMNWLTRKKRVSTPWTLWPNQSRIYAQPRGVVLIIAPWNYPFQLAILPLVGAIAAGNCVILKPSEISSHTERLLFKLISESFSQEYIACVTGGVETSTELLKQNFDFIFFTGSTPVGKIVMKAASENLTPVCLELGGKSPAIVEASANIELAAKRICWGKFLNAGQTCVAPDYVLIDKSLKADFVEELKKQIYKMYGEKAHLSRDYCKIINTKNFDRLVSLIDTDKILYGGDLDREKLHIGPTIVAPQSLNEAVMQEEIFGPILPIVEYTHLNEAIETIRILENPLALYLFTSSSDVEKKIFETLSFGGGCLNHTLLHLANHNLPFGGVKQSGMGAYHGASSFEVFSHQKSILRSPLSLEAPLIYPPHSAKKYKWLRRLLK